MLKKFAIFSLSSLLLCACTTVTPNKVTDEIASYDATTPSGYDVQNSGFIGFTDDGRGLITPFGLLRTTPSSKRTRYGSRVSRVLI